MLRVGDSKKENVKLFLHHQRSNQEWGSLIYDQRGLKHSKLS